MTKTSGEGAAVESNENKYCRVCKQIHSIPMCKKKLAELGDGEPSPAKSGHWFVTQRVVKKAVQWNGNNEYEIADFMPAEKFNISDSGAKLFIQTLEGCMEANVLDWIIRGVNGEFYPCKPDIFAKTYEPFESGAAQEVSPVGSVQKITGPERPRCPVCGAETTCLSCGTKTGGDTRELKAALKRSRQWKRFRKDNFFTQARLASVLGISCRTVEKIEGRKVDPHASTLHKFEILKEKYARASASERIKW